MIKIRKSEERGNADFGWLKAKHSFSFSSYHDPRHMHFRHLRVINQDIVQPEGGFATHPHTDMEIISYIIRGSIKHKDSMGNTETIRAGEVQTMSAGTGVEHSEYNPSHTEELELLQIWILPDKKGHTPRYDQKMFKPEDKLNQWRLIASPTGKEGSLLIHQDTSLFATYLEEGQSLEKTIEPKRYGWVQVVKGDIEVNGALLKPGDGAALSDEHLIKVLAKSAAEFLYFDLS